jgi:hypothetical protein
VVATDPSSPAVGVNVGAVHQTVTFDWNTPDAPVTVPILAGAPNPGEVDVTLTITPIDPPPNLKIGGPLHLRILASEDMLPPEIVSAQGTPQGIVLTFSKPMDPAGASNVNDYAVHAMSSSWGGIGGYSFSSFFGNHSSGPSQPSVRLQSAQYDPATRTVTLVPKRKLNYDVAIFTVSDGHQAKVSGRRGHHSNLGQGLTDLRGRPIGQFDFMVNRPA